MTNQMSNSQDLLKRLIGPQATYGAGFYGREPTFVDMFYRILRQNVTNFRLQVPRRLGRTSFLLQLKWLLTGPKPGGKDDWNKAWKRMFNPSHLYRNDWVFSTEHETSTSPQARSISYFLSEGPAKIQGSLRTLSVQYLDFSVPGEEPIRNQMMDFKSFLEIEDGLGKFTAAEIIENVELKCRSNLALGDNTPVWILLDEFDLLWADSKRPLQDWKVKLIRALTSAIRLPNIRCVCAIPPTAVAEAPDSARQLFPYIRDIIELRSWPLSVHDRFVADCAKALKSDGWSEAEELLQAYSFELYEWSGGIPMLLREFMRALNRELPQSHGALRRLLHRETTGNDGIEDVFVYLNKGLKPAAMKILSETPCFPMTIEEKTDGHYDLYDMRLIDQMGVRCRSLAEKLVSLKRIEAHELESLGKIAESEEMQKSADAYKNQIPVTSLMFLYPQGPDSIVRDYFSLHHSHAGVLVLVRLDRTALIPPDGAGSFKIPSNGIDKFRILEVSKLSELALESFTKMNTRDGVTLAMMKREIEHGKLDVKAIARFLSNLPYSFAGAFSRPGQGGQSGKYGLSPALSRDGLTREILSGDLTSVGGTRIIV